MTAREFPRCSFASGERLQSEEAGWPEAPFGFWKANLKTRCVVCSQQLCAMLCLPSYSSINFRQLQAMIEAADSSRLSRLAADALHRGGAYSAEFVMVRGDGHPRLLHTLGNVICEEILFTSPNAWHET